MIQITLPAIASIIDDIYVSFGSDVKHGDLAVPYAGCIPALPGTGAVVTNQGLHLKSGVDPEQSSSLPSFLDRGSGARALSLLGCPVRSSTTCPLCTGHFGLKWACRLVVCSLLPGLAATEGLSHSPEPPAREPRAWPQRPPARLTCPCFFHCAHHSPPGLCDLGQPQPPYVRS